ncbi:MAG TPA: ATP-dependent DNA helicase RecG, partial [Burkholderiaceae bacterium]|nr:ATP-dependent DNA helicase RecG [Burkholderiaceae bacterium]
MTDHGSRSKEHAARTRLGLNTDWDFLLHLPLRYEDETRVTPIARIEPGADAVVEGTVVRSEVTFRGRRQFVARLQDDTGELVLRFVHFYPSHRKQLAQGARVRAFGTARGGLVGLEMIHPRIAAAATTPLPTRLTPVYPTTAGVSQNWLRQRIERALREVKLDDVLPASQRERLQLPPLADALRGLHQPPAGADVAQPLAPWRQRLVFDELLAQQLSLRMARAARNRQRAPALRASREGLSARLLQSLPFRLTAAQQRVWREIEHDLAQAVPMNRLVQGDVGSGKTVVAALAAARAIEAGTQAALMAPTELLAEQHFGRIVQWLAPLGVEIAWLAGKLKAAEKRAAQTAVSEGRVQLVVGTHALIQEAVAFQRLGLAIVDEQHRFGVAQRLALRAAAERAKGDESKASAESEEREMPHLLMLSATPIPRTLAMSYFADLDVSVIDELPPGRQPVVTKLVSTARRDEVLARIRAEVQRGRQAYWVCPLVDDPEVAAETDVTKAAGSARLARANDDIALTAATKMYEETRALLPELRWGLLHGQLPAAEKTAVMQAFVAGQIDVLVATTVIEVGVDVPNASLMVIEHAQRFGLAQLHQLRGRVGRGGAQSFCVLLFDEPLSDAARERLKVIFETTDGFEVARRDLKMRGPGEFLGQRQSGVPLLRLADLERDRDLLEAARDVAAA